MKQNSYVYFHLNIYILWTKGPNQRANFRLSTARMKIKRILYVIFQATSQCSFKFCMNFQYLDT